MNVREAMTKVVLTVGPAHTLRQAARMMSAQRVGAVVVHPIGFVSDHIEVRWDLDEEARAADGQHDDGFPADNHDDHALWHDGVR